MVLRGVISLGGRQAPDVRFEKTADDRKDNLLALEAILNEGDIWEVA